ncbi:UNVERIFIED_CONTAM: Histone deacetylase HDT1 [Sesamum calycinum]|uniref:Histone deacetylase HDT1 n=1 Tax=Sesamum calycinum TaxID=2727403 RepID=A0AAW2N1B7_9LAMI
MEFWGVEVKSGEPLKVLPGDGMVLHLSQACLGELKKEKGNESVCLFVNVDGKKLVLGTLFTEKLPQQQFDLVFDQDFELSHNWKSGNDSESEEDIPLSIAKNGKPESKAKQEKPVEAEKASAAKGKESDAGKKGKLVEPNKDVKSQEDDESSDEDVMSEDDDEDDSEDEDDEDESDDESDESNKKTPKKVSVHFIIIIHSDNGWLKPQGPDTLFTSTVCADGKKSVATPCENFPARAVIEHLVLNKLWNHTQKLSIVVASNIGITSLT